ncbi:homoserine acetyltransferase [Saccharata proteae CBS 121410]|uniref:Homoserine acetyltransferase n=1 Tax=Saccharata proteae CBS 121410 TaxID=1314787 RepID=A0A9P4HMA8_9PEZI|nr:homoserine acetyltransferase [Saccharata proteae CBS 121410]
MTYLRTYITLTLKLAFRTYGDPANPAVLLPTCYGGKLDTTLPFLYEARDGPKPVLSPAKYFVVVCGLLGGGESSSPSTASDPARGPNFPLTTYKDNVEFQHDLCQHLGVKKLKAYIGFSMGGQQAYHMAALYPDFVERVVVLAGSARTSWHNWSFLEGPKAALVNSVDWHGGEYRQPVVKGTRAFARVYSTWALSQAWFRQKSWETLGFASLEEYLKVAWEDRLGAWDAHDLLCLLRTWQAGNITIFHPEDDGDLGKSLARIKAKVLLMPSRTDAYFPPEDNEEELKHLKHGQIKVIESIWGHLAGGGGGTSEDNAFVSSQIQRFMLE